MENRQSKRRLAIERIQNRLLASGHGEFFVTTDFVAFGDAPGRGAARRALTYVANLGPYGCREIHPGHWQAMRDVDAMTAGQIDMALQDTGNVLACLTRAVANDPTASDLARLRAVSETLEDLHGVYEVRGGWTRVYLDDNIKALVPELPETGALVSKLSGLVTWEDGVPTGTSPEANAYITELQAFCDAHR